jgi:hypothetical protein
MPSSSLPLAPLLQLLVGSAAQSAFEYLSAKSNIPHMQPMPCRPTTLPLLAACATGHLQHWPVRTTAVLTRVLLPLLPVLHAAYCSSGLGGIFAYSMLGTQLLG